MVVTDNTYGGTYRLFERVLRKRGLDFTYVDTSDVEATVAAFTDRTRMLFLETPTNPVLRLADIAALSAAAHARGDITVVVDNTFASPAVQQPLLLGADIVLHSTTKYLNGHSDSVGGMVVVKHAAHAEWLKFYQNAAGAILSAFDSWLILRGTKTLAVRMEAHNRNGQAIAEYLASTRRSIASTTPACRRIRSTPSRSSRCGATPAWCRSTSGRWSGPAGCSSGCGCLRWPRASAAWRA